MNSPTTSTEQMLATASYGVSSTLFSTATGAAFGWASVGVLGVGAFFFVILSLFAEKLRPPGRLAGGSALMHYVKDALPARKPRQFRREFPVVSESIIRCLLHIGGGGAGQREVDHQRPRHDLGPRDKAPEAGIVAVIAVVAKNEVLARRDRQFAVAC